MKTKLSLLGLITLAALVLVSGCKESGPSTRVFVKQSGERMRIAVLPFESISRDREAGRVVTNTVITYLLSTGQFDVVEPGVVYDSLAEEGMRTSEGLTLAVCQKLQTKLAADAFIVGLVEEYGEVRIGQDTYPSVSFSARLVDAQTAEILWAAAISKTGAENVKVFDIGRISSLGKLSKLAVKSMADSLAKSKDSIWTARKASAPADSSVVPVQGSEQTTVSPAVGTHGNTPATGTPASDENAKYMDESAQYGEAELKALLKDVEGAKLGEVTYKKHFHDLVETKYIFADNKFVEVKLVDYRKSDIARKFLKHEHPEAAEGTFENLPSISGESTFGYYQLDIAAGRFGLFLQGPKNRKDEIDKLGKNLIGLLK